LDIIEFSNTYCGKPRNWFAIWNSGEGLLDCFWFSNLFWWFKYKSIIQRFYWCDCWS